MKPRVPLVCLLAACGSSPSPPSTNGTTTVTVSAAPPQAATVDAPEPQPPEPTAPDELVGTLSLTKGAQPMLRGHLLSSDVVASHLGDDWRALAGHRVRVRGQEYVHVCDPRAQCLTGGKIPQMRNVVSVELCRSCRVTPAGMAAVVCPPTEEEITACVASCKADSDRCDANAKADRGRLRQCGSRWVGCRSSCRKNGESCP